MRRNLLFAFLLAASVMVAATVTTEQVAADAQCPADFRLVSYPGNDADHNGNGLVCLKGVSAGQPGEANPLLGIEIDDH
jgi:ABC-type phosphate/phosphonate transport system substrate-binding protein